MLGRKDYTAEELDSARKGIGRQLAAYRRLVDAANGDPKVAQALEAFEPILFTNMVFVLDRYFVHRLRQSSGKDGNPLNEVELMVESLLNNKGKFRTNKVIKYKPDEAVLKIEEGQEVKVKAAQFERLAKAFFADLESKFVQ